MAPAAPQHAVQDEITEAVTIAIAPAIAHAEQHRAMRNYSDILAVMLIGIVGVPIAVFIMGYLLGHIISWITRGFAPNQ